MTGSHLDSVVGKLDSALAIGCVNIWYRSFFRYDEKTYKRFSETVAGTKVCCLKLPLREIFTFACKCHKQVCQQQILSSQNHHDSLFFSIWAITVYTQARKYNKPVWLVHKCVNSHLLLQMTAAGEQKYTHPIRRQQSTVKTHGRNSKKRWNAQKIQQDVYQVYEIQKGM